MTRDDDKRKRKEKKEILQGVGSFMTTTALKRKFVLELYLTTSVALERARSGSRGGNVTGRDATRRRRMSVNIRRKISNIGSGVPPGWESSWKNFRGEDKTIRPRIFGVIRVTIGSYDGATAKRGLGEKVVEVVTDLG